MNTKAFLTVLALQSALLLGLITQQELRLSSATTILLETAPVDPRDLLRGDYVILNYKISNLRTDLWDTMPQGNMEGLTVYVSLEKRGEFHEAVQFSVTKPAPQPQRVVLQGRIHDLWNASVRVQYGLERYYVKEGTGNPRGKLTVLAAVAPDGKPVIKQVFLEGKPYAEAMRVQGKH